MKKLIIFAAVLGLSACEAPVSTAPGTPPTDLPTHSQPDCPPEVECHEP